MRWTEAQIPDQQGRKAIITGANTGIGFETARILATKNASVTLACRSQEKGEAAVDRIQAVHPQAQVSFSPLDLSDLESVQQFAERFRAANDRLDLLINNAGVMVPPESRTTQGHELQFGVNHLGHFALTGRLLPLLLDTPDSRVVNVSSVAHKAGRIEFDDLDFHKRGYKSWQAYGQSKLANLLFTQELAKRVAACGANTVVSAAHPGWTETDLQRTAFMARLMSPLLGMSPAQGCLPTLRAATDPEVTQNDYYGPHGIAEMKGYPVKVSRTGAAKDAQVAARLWDVSEEMTGVRYDFPAQAAA